MHASIPNRPWPWSQAVLPMLLILVLTGCTEAELQTFGHQITQGTVSAGQLSDQEIASGLREALRVGSERVVAQLGKTNGFAGDPLAHIPLPENLIQARRKLEKIGMASLCDDLELRLNRAAEVATPRAQELFLRAISAMTLNDARVILGGSEDAATRYFERQMSADLSIAMRPLIEQSLNEVGAIKTFNRAMASYHAIPFAPPLKTDLPGYVVDRGMRAIFLSLAREEAAIRNDPLKRTSALLRRVFART